MLDITHLLIANPLVGTGLAILALLCVYNVLRGQVRIAMGLWLMIIAVLFYLYLQVAAAPEPLPEEELAVPREQAP